MMTHCQPLDCLWCNRGMISCLSHAKEGVKEHSHVVCFEGKELDGCHLHVLKFSDLELFLLTRASLPCKNLLQLTYCMQAMITHPKLLETHMLSLN